MNLLMLFELQGRKIKGSEDVSLEFLTYFVQICSCIQQKRGNYVRRIYSISFEEFISSFEHHFENDFTDISYNCRLS